MTKNIKNTVIIYLAATCIFVFIVVLGLMNRKVNISVTPTNQVQTGINGTETQKLISFVDGAGNLLETNGEKAAYADFNKVGAWRQGNKYVFVYDLKGNALVLPEQPTLVGKNRLEDRDPSGKFFVKEMIDTLKTSNAGWLQYQYQKPGNVGLFTKLSYFKKVTVAGKTLLVGSGIYLD